MMTWRAARHVTNWAKTGREHAPHILQTYADIDPETMSTDCLLKVLEGFCRMKGWNLKALHCERFPREPIPIFMGGRDGHNTVTSGEREQGLFQDTTKPSKSFTRNECG